MFVFTFIKHINMSCVIVVFFKLFMAHYIAVVWPPKLSEHAAQIQPTSADKRMSICSQEVTSISEMSNVKVGYSSIREMSEDRPASPIPFKREPLDPKLVKTVKETAMKHSADKLELYKKKLKCETNRKSPTAVVIDRPREIKSLLVDASVVRSLSPVQVVVFPPELPELLPVLPRTPTPAKEKCRTLSPARASSGTPLGRRSKSPKGKKSSQGKPTSVKVEGAVNVKREVYKLETPQQREKLTMTIKDLPKPIMESGSMAIALATAPVKPFKPNVVTDRALIPTGKIDLPPDSEPYFPPEHGAKDDRVSQAFREAGCRSPMTDVLTTAPQRSYSPLPTATEIVSLHSNSTTTVLSEKNIDTTTSSVTNVGFHPIRKPVSMLSALTVAPSIPFTVPGKTPLPIDSLPVPSAFKPVSSTSPTFVPVPGRPHSPMKYYPAFTKIPQPSPPPEIVRGEFIDKEHIQYSTTMKPPSPRPMTSTIIKESTIISGKTDSSKSKQTIKSTESETYLLPYYQQNIGEIPVRNRSISPIRQIKAPTYSPSDKMLHPPPSIKQMSQTKVENSKTSGKIADDSSKSAFGLHAPNLLPYYQQNIGEIPVRNKSISPVPHPIRAPSFDPRKMTPSPKNYCYSSSSTVPIYGYRPSSASHSVSSTHTQTDVPQVKQIKEVIRESMSEETKKSSKEEKEIHKSVTKITQGVIRPASPSTWKAKVEKTVQNLSPLTVRIASPIPKPQGHTRESAGSNIHITHHRDHTATVSVTPIPDENNNLQETKGKVLGKETLPMTMKQLSSNEMSDQIRTVTTSQSPQIRATSVTGKHISFSPDQSNIDCNVGTIKSFHGQKTHLVEKNTHLSTAKHLSTQDKLTTKTSKQILDSKNTILATKDKQIHHVNEKTSPLMQTNKDFKPHLTGHCPSTSNHTNKTDHFDKPTTTTQGFTSKGTSFSSSNKQITQIGGSTKTVQNTFASDKTASDKSQTISKIISNTRSGSGQFPSHCLSSLGVSSSGDNGTGGGGGAGGKGSVAGATAPRRGRGVLNPNTGPQARIPLCGQCNRQIRGPFITALGKIWCPEHFVCVNAQCHRPLQDIGFVEEQEGLYCEFCFEKYLAPNCSKCNNKIKGDCLNAIGKQFHPECFCCTYCGKMFGNNPFFLEDSLPYCEADWNELFTTKCFACGFPIEAGDRWVEALSNNYHSQCFNCTMCKKNLEGQSFYAKGGRPFCKNHAR